MLLRRGRHPRLPSILITLGVVGLFFLSSSVVAPSYPSGNSSAASTASPSLLGPPIPKITLNRTSGPSYGEVEVSVSNFSPYAQPTVDLVNPNVPTYPINSNPFFYTNIDGNGSNSFFVYQTSVGMYEFTANGPSGVVTAAYEITAGTPTLTVYPTSGAYGDRIDVTGTGFFDANEVNVYIGSIATGYSSLGTVLSTVSGSISTSFVIPADQPAESYTVFAQDGGLNYGAAPFTLESIGPVLALSPVQGTVGTTVAASGSGLNPSTSFAITLGGATVCSGTTSSLGVYGCDFIVPPGLPGLVDAPHLKQAVATDGDGNYALGLFIELPLPSEFPAYMLQFSSSTIPNTPDLLAGVHGFLLDSYTITPPGPNLASRNEHATYKADAYLNVTMPYGQDALQFLGDPLLSQITLTGFANDSGLPIRFLNLTFEEDSVLMSLSTSDNTSQPLVTLTIKFVQMDVLRTLLPATDDWVISGSTSSATGPTYPEYYATNPLIYYTGELKVEHLFQYIPVAAFDWNGTTGLKLDFGWQPGVQMLWFRAHIAWLNLYLITDSTHRLELSFGNVLIESMTSGATAGSLPTFALSFISESYSYHEFASS